MPQVLVLHRRETWLRGIRWTLSRESSLKILSSEATGCAGQCSDSVDAVIMEAGQDLSRLLSTVSALRKRFPLARIILSLDRTISFDFATLYNLGVSAVLDEDASPEQIVSALHAALRGDLYVASGVLRNSHAKHVDTPGQLSDREFEVLRLLAQGMSNKEIAGVLSISEKTVKNHLYNAFRKLGVTGRTQAALWLAKGLFPFGNGTKGPVLTHVMIDK